MTETKKDIALTVMAVFVVLAGFLAWEARDKIREARWETGQLKKQAQDLAQENTGLKDKVGTETRRASELGQLADQRTNDYIALASMRAEENKSFLGQINAISSERDRLKGQLADQVAKIPQLEDKQLADQVQLEAVALVPASQVVVLAPGEFKLNRPAMEGCYQGFIQWKNWVAVSKTYQDQVDTQAKFLSYQLKTGQACGEALEARSKENQGLKDAMATQKQLEANQDQRLANQAEQIKQLERASRMKTLQLWAERFLWGAGGYGLGRLTAGR